MRDFLDGSVREIICLQCRRHEFDPWVGKIPWRGKWQPTPVSLPEKSHGQRSLASYSLWGHKESDMAERLSTPQIMNRQAKVGDLSYKKEYKQAWNKIEMILHHYKEDLLWYSHFPCHSPLIELVPPIDHPCRKFEKFTHYCFPPSHKGPLQAHIKLQNNNNTISNSVVTIIIILQPWKTMLF